MALYGLLTTQGERDAADDLAKKQAYQPLLRQMPTTAAAALGPLLSAKDEGAQRQGISLLEEYFRRNSPQGRQLLQNAQDQGYATRQQVDMAASEEARRNQLFPGQLKAQDYAASQDKRNQQLLEIQQEQLRMELEKITARNREPLPLAQIYENVNGGKVPDGMRAVARMAPDGQGNFLQFVDAQPIEGTPNYRDSVLASRAAEEGLLLIDSFRQDLAEYGTEMGGADALKMRQKRGRLIANYGFVMEKLGILQPGDLERLDGELPNPTNFGNQFNPSAAGNIDAVYAQYYEQWQKEVLDPAREVYWWVKPKPVTPVEQADARKKSGSL